MRLRSSGALIALFLSAGLGACSAVAPPKPIIEVDVAAPKAAASTRFRGEMTIDLAPLGGVEPGPAGDAVASTVRDRRRALLECMRPLPASPTDVWIVGRVGTDGRLSGLSAAAELPADVSACAIKALDGIRVPSGDPFALSVVLWGEPAPADCKGEDCVLLPIPPGLGHDDEPLGDSMDVHVNVLGPLSGDATGGFDGFGQIGPDGEGIGVGAVGTLGHGVGNGAGRARGKRGKAPTLRMGSPSISGRLPVEVIKRIVRQNFGRFRLCYEQGLKTNAALAGAVRLEFTIASDGSVSHHSSANSELPDPKVVSCVENATASLTFPMPEGGVVKVTYPMFFAPPDEPEMLQVGGVGFRALDAAKVAARLGEKGWRVMAVPGASEGDPFVVFAIQSGASTNPVERPQGFITSVRREPAEGSTSLESRESEGLRLVAEGHEPKALLDDLVDKAQP